MILNIYKVFNINAYLNINTWYWVTVSDINIMIDIGIYAVL